MSHNSVDDDNRRTPLARSDLRSVLKRAVVRTGLLARTKIGEVAQALADVCVQPRDQVRRRQDRGKGSGDFSDLPAYAGILKHRELGKLFTIGDPFYRCHDGRAGTETWIEGRRYLNFASYDYLGLNHHPALAEAKTCDRAFRHLRLGEPHRRGGETAAPRARDGPGRLLRCRARRRLCQRSRHQCFDHWHAHER
jgi:hypothetical protein